MNYRIHPADLAQMLGLLDGSDSPVHAALAQDLRNQFEAGLDAETLERLRERRRASLRLVTSDSAGH